MYTLKEAWSIMVGEMPCDDWDGKIYCRTTDAAITLRTNLTQGFMSAYTFTLVTEGSLRMVYNGTELTLSADDLYCYCPGMSVSVLDISPDYEGICLLVDETTTLGMPSVRDMVEITYAPIVQLHKPILKLPHETALRLAAKMHEIIDLLHSNHIYKQEILHMLCAVFLLEVQGIQQSAMPNAIVPQRVRDIFMDFIRLLPKHFVEHRDIGFYASQLSISTVYLSRVVRQVSGRTVLDYINQMLLMEASFLLSTSSKSITQISDSLHFADVSSFSKFFSRMTGISPRKYREG